MAIHDAHHTPVNTTIEEKTKKIAVQGAGRWVGQAYEP
jgi:hypothetical protein